jgi:4-amino-4-deoxy-L-arabinose transferase-like glycosyltransferase
MLGPAGGRFAALIYATAPIVAAESKLATTDATLALWVLGCQSSLWVLQRRSSAIAATALWVCLSLSFLTKGPIGPALVAVAAAVGCWCGWTLPPRERLHLRWGLAGFVLLTCPWFVIVTIASRGEFLRFAVGDQMLRRVASDVETHGGFPGYYPAVSAVVFYPWSAFLPAALAGAWARRRADPTLAFLLGWIVGPLILLECVRTKLIHYYLPAFPACALLVAWVILRLSEERVSIRQWRFGRVSVGMLAVVGLALASTLCAGAVILSNGVSALLLVLASLVAGGMIAGTSVLRRGGAEKAVYTLAGCWGVILVLATGWVIPMGESARTSRIVGRKLGDLSRKLAIEPVLLEYQEPGVIYEIGHPVALIRDRDGFFAHIRGGRSVATVLLDFEIPVMRSLFGLDVDIVDEIAGYRLTKGKKQTLYLAVVKEASAPSGDELPGAATARGGRGEQTLVQ